MNVLVSLQDREPLSLTDGNHRLITNLTGAGLEVRRRRLMKISRCLF